MMMMMMAMMKSTMRYVTDCSAELLPYSLVVSLPEFDRTGVGGDEDCATQNRVEWRGEEGREHSLNKQHGRIWDRVRVKEHSIQTSRVPCIL